MTVLKELVVNETMAIGFMLGNALCIMAMGVFLGVLGFWDGLLEGRSWGYLAPLLGGPVFGGYFLYLAGRYWERARRVGAGVGRAAVDDLAG